MAKPTLPEMSRKVYEAMVWKRTNSLDVLGELPLHIWYVLEWILNKMSLDVTVPIVWLWFENTVDDEGKDFIIRDEYCWKVMYMWKDRSQPIPLDPDESRRPLLEFLYSLIE